MLSIACNKGVRTSLGVLLIALD